MVDSSLVLIYNRLCRVEELANPNGVAAEILQWLEFNNSGFTTESLLLWLSIVRRIFSDYSTHSCEGVKQEWERIRKEKLERKRLIMDHLLQAHSFIPLMVRCLQSKDQLASFLASKVLSLALQLPLCNAEACLTQLGSLMNLSRHEPMYGLQVMKSYSKSVAKTRDVSSAAVLHTSLLKLWQECSMALSSKLVDASSSKWPELNFVVFLEISIKMLHGENHKFKELILTHLDYFTFHVTKNCRSITTLRKTIMLCRRIIMLLKTESEVTKVNWSAASRGVYTLLESRHLQETVRGVVKQVSCAGDEGDSEGNLKRSVTRELLVLVMNFAGVLQDDADIVGLEKQLATFVHSCGLELGSGKSSIQSVRHHMVHLMCDQDTDLLEMITASLSLWRKRTLWLPHSTLSYCFQCTRLHSLLAIFLHSVSYDHSVLLDFLISSETHRFINFMHEFADICVQDWSSLCEACSEIESIAVQDCEDAGISSTVMLAEVTSEPVYHDTVLDRIMNCYTQLKYSLSRLAAQNLLPFHAEPLISKIEQMEDFYEKE